jgi:predicted GNAT superfamily acetyltransferase
VSVTTTTAPLGDIEIRMLSTPDQLGEANGVLQAIWGTPVPLAPLEFLTAIAHTGGYVSGAFVDDTMVGASIGMLARHHGAAALHSHVTGLVEEMRGTGLGRAIKLHQRAWAIDRDLRWITWTFDPLVRRNAWFNIAVLGAAVDEYLPAFYGTMHDAINAGDESDRLLAAWDLTAALRPLAFDGTTDAPEAELVATPRDIVELRRTDPAAARAWRVSTRNALTAALDAGRAIIGFTRDGEYVIGSAP